MSGVTPESRFSNRAMALREVEILRALLDIFAERGCFATNLDAVATAVGIGKGSIYRHFESRDALFRAALEYGAAGLVARCRQIWDADPGALPAARLLAVVTELVALNERSDPQAPNTLLRLSCSNQWTPSGDVPGTLAAAFVPLVQEWQRAELCDPAEDPHWIGVVLLGLVSALPLTHKPGTERPEPLAARLVTLLRRAFLPPTSV
ncbi:MAG: hypothetical protein A3I61_10765 [Acidobacteria bacterium RIFCSPLOWO2_02_FULL_68_18]|nr:MAG: hypothetical protein A3I61_10765 [Acidobacteria bacterium RIFCSPLOWO2_02_FULL_68_18]OFW48727.1 MAG: hypothetical protein A3G77_14595 [Acidobacteria bacterium RIFCSPLOWO2_12_FULL_68_19]